MFWVRAQFKDRCKVWASSDESGEFQVQAGKVPIKYNLAGKRYDAAVQMWQRLYTWARRSSSAGCGLMRRA